MELVISGRELDELLRTTVGWIRAEIEPEGVVLRLKKGPFRKKITILRIAFEEQMIVVDHDSMLVDMLKSLPPVRDMLQGASVRMEGRRVYLNFTKALLATAQIDDVHAKFKSNQLKLCIRLRRGGVPAPGADPTCAAEQPSP